MAGTVTPQSVYLQLTIQNSIWQSIYFISDPLLPPSNELSRGIKISMHYSFVKMTELDMPCTYAGSVSSVFLCSRNQIIHTSMKMSMSNWQWAIVFPITSHPIQNNRLLWFYLCTIYNDSRNGWAVLYSVILFDCPNGNVLFDYWCQSISLGFTNEYSTF